MGAPHRRAACGGRLVCGTLVCVALAAPLPWTACTTTSRPHTPTNTPTPTCSPFICTTPIPGNNTFLSITQAAQTHGPVTLSSSRWQYDFCARKGTTFHFSVCRSGGSYAGDTIFSLVNDNCSEVNWSDDFCGSGSEINWSADDQGPAFLNVRSPVFGTVTYTLAYWHD